MDEARTPGPEDRADALLRSFGDSVLPSIDHLAPAHVAAMLAEGERVAAEGAPRRAMPSPWSGWTRRRARIAPILATAFAVLVSTAGLCLANVLPAPAQRAVEHVVGTVGVIPLRGTPALVVERRQRVRSRAERRQEGGTSARSTQAGPAEREGPVDAPPARQPDDAIRGATPPATRAIPDADTPLTEGAPPAPGAPGTPAPAAPVAPGDGTTAPPSATPPAANESAPASPPGTSAPSDLGTAAPQPTPQPEPEPQPEAQPHPDPPLTAPVFEVHAASFRFGRDEDGGRTVRLRYDSSERPCFRPGDLRVRQFDKRVVVTITQRLDRACTSAALVRIAIVRLDRPLGDRRLVDGSSGEAVPHPYRGPRPGASARPGAGNAAAPAPEEPADLPAPPTAPEATPTSPLRS